MIVQVGENLSVEVCFDPSDREQGFDDEIRFRIHESGSKDMRLFEADETSFLLTIEQAEDLAVALRKAAAEARSLPRSVYPGSSKPGLVDDCHRVGATDRAVDTIEAPPEPLCSARLGGPADPPTALPQGMGSSVLINST